MLVTNDRDHFKRNHHKSITIFIGILLLALAYFLLGKMGQILVVHQVSPIWPAAGIALASLLLFGYSLWPGIFLGSFILNIAYNYGAEPLVNVIFSSALIAVGSTISALLAAYFSQKIATPLRLLATARSTTIFLLIAGFISTLISATIGTFALTLFHLISSTQFLSIWLTWWLGDGMGVAIFAPLLLCLYEKPWKQWMASELPEFILLILLVILICLIRYNEYPVRYFIIPCIIVACFRLDRTRMLLLMVLVSIIETSIALQQQDVITFMVRKDTLLFSQLFITIVTTTALVLSSVLEERKKQASELKQMKNQAEVANQIKSTFLENMSHELRTPLNAIIGYAEDLAYEAKNANFKKEHQEDLTRIVTSARKVAELINDILNMSQIESGKFNINLEEIKVSALCEDLEGLMKNLAKENNNQFKLKCDIGVNSSYDFMRTDLVKLRQCLFNLLSNAAKFTQRGVITLEIKSLLQNGDYIQFIVRDTGIGIAVTKLDNLFQAFYQVDSSFTRKFGGTGIGLYLTYEFCKALKGSISVKSEEGKGSEFIITIPRVLSLV